MDLPLTPESYSPHVDSDFSVRCDDGEIRVFKLTAVKSHIDDEVQHSFSLLFDAPGTVLEQRVYSLAHPQLGEIALFLVPVRQRRGGVAYEAVFNLLRDTPQ